MYAMCCDVTNAMCMTGGVVYIFSVRLEKTNKILKYLSSEMFLFLLLGSNTFISACLECAGCFVHTLSACWNATCDAGIDFG